MLFYDLSKNIKSEKITDLESDRQYFILCSPSEVRGLQKIYNLDDSTIDEINFDQKVRFTSYYDYDFVSLMYFSFENSKLNLDEINLYLGKNYLILVIPETFSSTINLKKVIVSKINELINTKDILTKIYYKVFDIILTDFSTTLEYVEDEIISLEDEIINNTGEFSNITSIKETIYAIKKQLRSLLYVGDQFIVNENGLISKDNLRFFKNLDIRINQLYDFSNSLQEYSNQLLSLYDSKITMLTNNKVTGLTIITIFFGPLTVITGIFGMNFENMPELKWQLGYPYAVLLMVITSILVYIVLKVKKWM